MSTESSLRLLSHYISKRCTVTNAINMSVGCISNKELDHDLTRDFLMLGFFNSGLKERRRGKKHNICALDKVLDETNHIIATKIPERELLHWQPKDGESIHILVGNISQVEGRESDLREHIPTFNTYWTAQLLLKRTEEQIF